MEQASSVEADRRTWRKRALLIGAIAVACFAAAVALLLLTTGDDDNDGGKATDLEVGKPATVQEDELRAFGRAQALPVYWAGPRREREYELTRTADGRVFVRYLPEGAEAGDPRPRFLTVASYAQPNAYRYLRAQSRRRGWTGQTTGSGALVA